MGNYGINAAHDTAPMGNPKHIHAVAKMFGHLARSGMLAHFDSGCEASICAMHLMDTEVPLSGSFKMMQLMQVADTEQEPGEGHSGA